MDAVQGRATPPARGLSNKPPAPPPPPPQAQQPPAPPPVAAPPHSQPPAVANPPGAPLHPALEIQEPPTPPPDSSLGRTLALQQRLEQATSRPWKHHDVQGLDAPVVERAKGVIKGGGGGGGAGGIVINDPGVGVEGKAIGESGVHRTIDIHQSADRDKGAEVSIGDPDFDLLRFTTSPTGTPGASAGVAIGEEGVQIAVNEDGTASIAVNEEGTHNLQTIDLSQDGHFAINEPGVHVNGMVRDGQATGSFAINEPGLRLAGRFGITEDGVVVAGRLAVDDSGGTRWRLGFTLTDTTADPASIEP